MSVGTSLRKFLLEYPEGVLPIRQIAEERIPESYAVQDGFMWFAVRSGQQNLVLDPTQLDAGRVPVNQDTDEIGIDLEIYHPDKDPVETVTRLISGLNGYHGTFGDGFIGALFVDGQQDDYVQTVGFDDDQNVSQSFLNLDIRLYKEI
ncbi:MAG: hypothetical protein AAFU85_11560 [Planctomycetota bacterium]